MSKELEALERLRNTLLAESYWQDVLQDVSVIEKSLKALEIIKEKKVNVEWLLETENVEEYNESLYADLTKEEYELLKEMLK